MYFEHFWEPALLPAFSIFAFYFTLRFIEAGEWRYLLGAFLSVTMAISCHLLSIFLLLPIVTVPILFGKRITLWQLAMCFALLVPALYSWHAWLYSQHPGIELSAGVAIVISAVAIRHYPGRERLVWCLCLLVPVLILLVQALFRGGQAILGPMRVIFDFITPMGSYPYFHVAIEKKGPELYLFPEALLLLIYLYRTIKEYWRLTTSQKILAYWNFSTVGAFLISASFMTTLSHQWALFLFPTLWIAILVPLADLHSKHDTFVPYLFPLAILVLVLPAVVATLDLQRIVLRGEAAGWHATSLTTKRNIRDYIATQSALPNIYLATKALKPLVDYHAWYYIEHFDEDSEPMHARTEKKYWYIYTKGELQESAEQFSELKKDCAEKLRIGVSYVFLCENNAVQGQSL
jgi:hypothetical protein